MAATQRQHEPQDATARAAVLHSVAELLSRPVTKDQLLRAMVDRVTEALDAERGTLFLLDAVSGELCSRVAHLPELAEIRIPVGQGAAGRVAASGEALRIADAQRDARFYAGIDARTGFTTRTILAVPVRDEEGLIRGVLEVLNRREGCFSSGDQLLLGALAAQVAEALTRTSMRPIKGGAQGVLVDGPFNNIVGESPQMRALYQRMLAAASTDASVLVRGESGTGKTLVARAIHDNSARASGPLVHVDCTALPAGLIESELFGHERGAFTGAERQVPGKFELAAGGTLFLDEIGELPLALQSKLLRFLQDHRFERVGGRETLCADVRVITATNAQLEERVAAGAFRRDLYYRIRVVELRVPALRQRGDEDIELMAAHFLDVYARRHRRPGRELAPAALRRLLRHDWPGNVRELEHCIESAVVLCDGPLIDEDHLSLPPLRRAYSGADAGYPPGTPLADVERDHIQRTVQHCGGNRSRAARALGIGRNTLLRKLGPGG